MKCDNLFVDSCPLLVCCYFTITSCLLIHFGWAPSLPNTLLCVVDRCMFYRLLNAYVFNASDAQMPFFPPCERDSVISVCQMWHVLAFLLHLFNDPDIAMEHTHTRIVLLVILFPLMDQVLLYY